MVNKVNLQRVIDHMAHVPDESFDMNTWVYTDKITAIGGYADEYIFEHQVQFREDVEKNNWCGTSGCIAGHIWILLILQQDSLLEEAEEADESLNISDVASNFLELSEDDEYQLFTPPMVDMSTISRAGAIMVLEHFRDTGEIDWNICPGVKFLTPTEALMRRDLGGLAW